MVWKISSIYSCVGKPCSHQNIFPRYLNKRMGMLKNRETWTRHSVKSERSTHTLKLISYMEFLPGVQLKPEERVKRLTALWEIMTELTALDPGGSPEKGEKCNPLWLQSNTNKYVRKEYFLFPARSKVWGEMAYDKYFSLLEAAAGLWQARWKTDHTFVHIQQPHGETSFLRLPLGLCLALELLRGLW